MADPITAEQVRGWLRLPPDTGDEDLVAECTAATVTWCRRLPAAAADPWPADLQLGAVMLAARLWRRRNSPGGVESMADTAVYGPRRDSDVDRLLGLGAYETPRVG